MTTSSSPIAALRKQANATAALLKQMERGESVGVRDPLGKLAAARARESIVFGMLMDDKTLKIEMTWATIKQMSEAQISRFIVQQMRGHAPQ